MVDFIGLDTELSIANSLYEETKDPKYAPRCFSSRWSQRAGWEGNRERVSTITHELSHGGTGPYPDPQPLPKTAGPTINDTWWCVFMKGQMFTWWERSTGKGAIREGPR